MRKGHRLSTGGWGGGPGRFELATGHTGLANVRDFEGDEGRDFLEVTHIVCERLNQPGT